MRWQPFPMPAADVATDFVAGLTSLCGAGSPECKTGTAIHVYMCNRSMVDSAFCNSDGDFLIVPQEGVLHIRTEFGLMDVAPGEMCVIQRGMRFAVSVDGPSRGYINEIFKAHFVLPDLGPIGTCLFFFFSQLSNHTACACAVGRSTRFLLLGFSCLYSVPCGPVRQAPTVWRIPVTSYTPWRRSNIASVNSP
jgi:homogentisate 1,2-dioxygenase